MPTITTEQIETRVCEAIVTFGPDPAEVHRAALFTDLDVDSLDLVELGQIVEDEFGVKLEAADIKELATIGDFIDLVEKRSS
jgi:acyl carrier protein